MPVAFWVESQDQPSTGETLAVFSNPGLSSRLIGTEVRLPMFTTPIRLSGICPNSLPEGSFKTLFLIHCTRSASVPNTPVIA